VDTAKATCPHHEKRITVLRGKFVPRRMAASRF
jgi:hypothetical protein